MNCKCKDCRYYHTKTDITGDCSLRHFVTFENATCEKSEKADGENQIMDFLNGIMK